MASVDPIQSASGSEIQLTRGRKRARPEKEDLLHTVGYRVYRSVFKIPEAALNDVVAASQGEIEIFNYNESKRNDFKRLEATMDRRKCRKETKQFLTKVDQFVSSTVSSALKPSRWSVIHSKAGCQSQAPHCDYVPDLALAKASDAHMPLSVLVALMPGTRLNIWPHSIRLATLSGRVLKEMEPISCEELLLEPGDLLVFRGDFIHAGSSYAEENYRLHTFLDSPEVPRDPNTTWTVHQDGEAELKRIILQKM